MTRFWGFQRYQIEYSDDAVKDSKGSNISLGAKYV